MALDRDSVDYQVRTKIVDLAVEIAEGRSYRRTRVQQRTALRLLQYAHALDYRVYMTDAQIENIYACLVSTAEIDSYPVAPLITPAPAHTINNGIITFINNGVAITFNRGLEETSGNVVNVKYSDGIKLNSNNQLTLDLEAKTLVTPTIVGDHTASAIWELRKNDNVTAYSLRSGVATDQAITVHNGVNVYVHAKYSYPSPTSSQVAPTTISGDFGATDPGAGVFSATFTNGGVAITTADSFAVTLAAPKSGLIVVGDQVEFASGNNTTSDSVSVTFSHDVFFGYSTSTSLLEADIQALATKRFGDKSETFTGVTATGGKYTYFVYPASYGALTSVILDGSSPILGAFSRQSDVNITNDGGLVVAMAVYRSNATDAFTDNSLAFS